MQQKNFVILDVPTADAVLPMFYDSLGIYYERLSTLLIFFFFFFDKQYVTKFH